MANSKFSFDDLMVLSIDELVELNKMAIEVIKTKRRLEGTQKGYKLVIDAEVQINHAKHKGDLFIVKKINKTKAVLQHKKTNVSYDVPFSMIII
jgi:transcription elongation factor